MAFGYIEADYEVEAKHSHPSRKKPSNTVHYELRRPDGGAVPYIAVLSTSSDGSVVADNLLRYEDEQVCLHDWARLIGPASITPNEMHFVERIQDHYCGYFRDGAVAMY